jgi:hypothetical protein
MPHTVKMEGDCANGAANNALRILHFETNIPKAISTWILIVEKIVCIILRNGMTRATKGG